MKTITEIVPAWLRDAADPSVVSRAIETNIPDFGPNGSEILEQVELTWRLKKGESLWNGIVSASSRTRNGGEVRTTRILARLDPQARYSPRELSPGPVFGQTGWTAFLPDLAIHLSVEPDLKLPSLSWLTDSDLARPVLVRMLTDYFGDIGEVENCTPTVLRYKPGSRCTVGFELHTQPGRAPVPNPVIAKTYAGKKGAIAYEAMAALWKSDLRDRTDVAIAEPLGYDSALRLLLQGPVAGDRTLESIVIDTFSSPDGDIETLEGLVRQVARGLAAIHRTPVEFDAQRRWGDDLEELVARRDRVVQAIPNIADYASSLIHALEDLNRASAPQPDVPSHGSFRAAQVLVAGGGNLGFIDFDSFTKAEPAMDVAEFSFRLEQLALVKMTESQGGRQTLDRRREQVDVLVAAFVEEYTRFNPIDQQRLVLWWTVDALSLLFSSFTKLKLSRLPGCMELLRHITQTHGLPVL